MSLSPKDDPRTWLVPGPREVPRPPLQARLLYYELTKSQRALLRAMLEQAPEGALWEADPKTYAGASGLSVKHIYNLIHGWVRNSRHTPGLLKLRVLKCVRKAKRLPDPKPAAYAFNESALRLQAAYFKTGGRSPADPARDPSPRRTCRSCFRSATVADDGRKLLPRRSATVAATIGNRCRRLKATTSKTLIQERERFSNSNPLSLLDEEREIENDWAWIERRGYRGR